MRITTRLIVSFVAMTILPLILLGLVIGFWTIAEGLKPALKTNQDLLRQMGEETIYDKALSAAAEVALYLEAHPELLTAPDAVLNADPRLAAIAVQPVGKTGYTAMHDNSAISHFHKNPAIVGSNLLDLRSKLPEFVKILEAGLGGQEASGYYDWIEPDGKTIRRKYMASVPVVNTRFRIAATTYIDEFEQPVRTTEAAIKNIQRTAQTRLIIIVVIVSALSVVIALILAQSINRPLSRLTQAAQEISAGRLDQPIELRSRNEFGTLAKAFNTMTTQLRLTLEGLEQRVSERTAELAKTTKNMQYRAEQLQTVADVAHVIASIQDPERLLPDITQTISERFGFYHVGIFLTDRANEHAVLRAASSEGGQRMLARGHRLRIGLEGIVGYVTSHAEPRIALDVGSDAVFFNNPDLPQTRSEMALPLITAGKVIGALDVQSTKSAAFTEEDIKLLLTLADQVAIAIQNAALYGETRQALIEAQTAQRQYLQQAWEQLVSERGQSGYQFSFGQMSPIPASSHTDIWDQIDQHPDAPIVHPSGPTAIPGSQSITVPISLRGQTIGLINIDDNNRDSSWSQEEIDLAKTIADQIALAIENARLLENTQRRAEREHQVAEITTKLRASNDPQTILQTAVEELRRALHVQDARILISSAQGSGPTPSENPPASTSEPNDSPTPSSN